MNCNNCVSAKVCKMKHLLDSQAAKLADSPYSMYGTGGPEASLQRHIEREGEINNLFGNIVAEHCRLYLSQKSIHRN